MSYTPLDVFGQSVSSFNNSVINGIRGLDVFGKSTLNTLNRGMPTPQTALSTIFSLPNAFMPKAALPLSLPDFTAPLGAAANEMQRGINLTLPQIKSFGNLLPNLGNAGSVTESASNPTLFGDSKTEKGNAAAAASTQSANDGGIALF